ncbi:MAG: amidohydrolase [Cytophagales bacterium]|nr:amidohydrolase [Cytophagales bacterium]
MYQELRLALLEVDLQWEDKKANFAQFDSIIESLPKETDVVVLPEMFTTGFSMNAALLAEHPQGPTLEWMKSKAKQIQGCITGSIIVREDERYFNRLYWVFPDGTFYYYDKRHLFRFGEEDTVYSPGQKLLRVVWKGWQICPLICYDLRFPVWSRNLMTDPFDLLIYVANWPAARTQVWDTLLKARAMENVCYVAATNRIGVDGRELVYEGHSQAVDPKGILIHEQTGGSSAVMVTLDQSLLFDFRKKFNTLLDGDNFQIIL